MATANVAVSLQRLSDIEIERWLTFKSPSEDESKFSSDSEGSGEEDEDLAPSSVIARQRIVPSKADTSIRHNQNVPLINAITVTS